MMNYKEKGTICVLGLGGNLVINGGENKVLIF
jgi:hypothetical protein